VRHWPAMQRQIQERNANGFETHEVLINGVSIREIGGKGTVLLAQTTVDFTANGKRASYGVNFISDAATLLVVFRVAQEQTTGKKQRSYKKYVVLVEQARWGKNNPESLEIPGGLLSDNETFDIKKSWDNPMRGALREFIEETNSEGKKVLPFTIRPSEIRSLGKPLVGHPAMSDKQHQFYVEIDMTTAQFKKTQVSLTGKRGGQANEGEATVVKVLPFNIASKILLETGNAPDASVALARYAKISKGLAQKLAA